MNLVVCIPHFPLLCPPVPLSCWNTPSQEISLLPSRLLFLCTIHWAYLCFLNKSGWDVIYWSKSDISRPRPLKKMILLSQRPLTINGPSGRGTASQALFSPCFVPNLVQKSTATESSWGQQQCHIQKMPLCCTFFLLWLWHLLFWITDVFRALEGVV